MCVTETDRGVQCCERPQAVIFMQVHSCRNLFTVAVSTVALALTMIQYRNPQHMLRADSARIYSPAQKCDRK